MMNSLINKRIANWRKEKRLTVLLAAVLCVAVAAGGVAGLLSIINAAPLGYPVIFNIEPYAAPNPAPVMIGPDRCAWSHLQDHPGNDTAYTAARSRAYTGDTSPNHVYLGSSALVFQGYDSQPVLDYVFAEDYVQFESVSFILRPIELSMHALSQGGFFFNGKIEAGNLYTGYALILETVSNDAPGAEPNAQYANLRLYYVKNACLDDAETFAQGERSLVSTYAVNLSSQAVWPINVRVECDAQGLFQVFVDGDLRTRDLVSVGAEAGFGFFAGYTDHDCTDLTVMAFSNVQISVPGPWMQKSAKATVHFINATNGQALADPQTRTGVTGQRYYINPPGFSGYNLIEDNQRLLDPIPYFVCDGNGDCDCNATYLYYTPLSKEGSYKEATYDNQQNNGTAKNPVPVEVGEYIDYMIHAGGDGTRYEGNWVSTVVGSGLMSMRNFSGWSIGGPNGGSGTFYQQHPGGPLRPMGIDSPSTSNDGKYTVEANYPIQIDGVSYANNTTNDGVLVGFRPIAWTSANPNNIFTVSNFQINGNPGLPALPYITPFPPRPTHFPSPPVVFSAAACSTSGSGQNITHNLHANAQERYIKLTYNQLRNDAGYKIQFFYGAWSNGQPGDYIISIRHKDIQGTIKTTVINRSTLFSPNNGWTTDSRPASAYLPIAVDYVDLGAPAGRQQYIFPIDGKIEVTFTRVNNTRHDFNILVGLGEMEMYARNAVMRVTDYLPPGVKYVPGSSGQYEGNLTITNNPDGSQTLVWEFGVVPPDGYDIHFQVHIEQPGLFVNRAEVVYIAPAALPAIHTNRTYHQTGDPVGVTEHFLDYNYPHDTLKGDRFIAMPPGGDYITSIESMSNILYEGNTYRYVGYKRIGIDSGIQPGVPPDPAIGNVLKPEEIELYFAKNPLITVEFRDLLTGQVVLKTQMTFPVLHGDPFFIPDSVRESIFHDNQWYNYIAYSKEGFGGVPIEDVPGKPIYPSVTEDQTVVVYFTPDLAVTVRYVEYGQPANVLKNNDYFLVALGDDFVDSVKDPALMGELMSPITSVGKRYVYEGYSYPDDIATVFPGPFPPFEDMQENKEIILHFSTVYLVTLKYHENIPYADGVAYKELLGPVTLTVKAGSRFEYDGQDFIFHDGDLYHYIGDFKWETDARPAQGGPAIIESVHGDYTIIFLYEKDPDPPPDPIHSVVVMYREYGFTANILKDDDHHELPDGSNFDVVTPPVLTKSGTDYTYYAYQIDNGPVIPGPPPTNYTFADIDADHVIILQYVPDGSIFERFRELDNEGNILSPDQLVAVPGGGNYSPKYGVPWPRINDAYYVYTYVGYRVDGQDGDPLDQLGPPPSSLPVGQKITYLYEKELSENTGGAIFAKADASANGAASGWNSSLADPAALGVLTDRLEGAKFSIHISEADARNGVHPLHFESGPGTGNYLLNPLGAITEITTGASGIFTVYGAFMPGFTYWIVETEPPQGYLPEEEPYPFVVTVNGSAPNAFALFDEIIPDPTAHALGAEKTTVGRNMAAGQFSFELWRSNAAGQTLALLQTSTNASAGANSDVDFTAVTYDRSGTYYYIIKEFDKGALFWTYDDTEYLVKVEVENNAGVLGLVSVEFTPLGEDAWEDYANGANRPLFVNAYDTVNAPTGKVAITGEKRVTGDEAPDEVFGFMLLWVDENGDEIVGSPPFAMPPNATVDTSGPAPWMFKFDEITGLLADATYYFAVVEVDEDKLGWSYDLTPRIVTVVVDELGQVVRDIVSGYTLRENLTEYPIVSEERYHASNDIANGIGAASVLRFFDTPETFEYFGVSADYDADLPDDVPYTFEEVASADHSREALAAALALQGNTAGFQAGDGLGAGFTMGEFNKLFNLDSGTSVDSRFYYMQRLVWHHLVGPDISTFDADHIRCGQTIESMMDAYEEDGSGPVTALEMTYNPVTGLLEFEHVGYDPAQYATYSATLEWEDADITVTVDKNDGNGPTVYGTPSGIGVETGDEIVVAYSGTGTPKITLKDSQLYLMHGSVKGNLLTTEPASAVQDFITGYAQFATLHSTLTLGREADEAVVITNAYPTGKVTFTGEKVLEGDNIPENYSFTFRLAQAHANGELMMGTPIERSVTITQDDPLTFAFERITHLLAKTTYYFLVWETNGGEPGWTYDEEPRFITVHVDAVGEVTVIEGSATKSSAVPVPPVPYGIAPGKLYNVDSSALPTPNFYDSSTRGLVSATDPNETYPGMCAEIWNSNMPTAQVTDLTSRDNTESALAYALASEALSGMDAAQFERFLALSPGYTEEFPVGGDELRAFFMHKAIWIYELCYRYSKPVGPMTAASLANQWPGLQDYVGGDDSGLFATLSGSAGGYTPHVDNREGLIQATNMIVKMMEQYDLGKTTSLHMAYDPTGENSGEITFWHEGFVPHAWDNPSNESYDAWLKWEGSATVTVSGVPSTDGTGGVPVKKDDTITVTYTGEPPAFTLVDNGYYLKPDSIKGSLLHDPVNTSLQRLIAGNAQHVTLQCELIPGGNLTFTNFYEKPGIDFIFYKTDERGQAMAGVQFQLYACGNPAHGPEDHDSLNDGEGCWELSQTAVSGTVPEDSDYEDLPGQVIFTELPSGYYLLAETATAAGYQLPHAQWLVHIQVGGEPEISITAFGGTPPGFMLDEGELYLANYPVLVLPRAGSTTMLLSSAGGTALLGGAVALTAGAIRKRKRKA